MLREVERISSVSVEEYVSIVASEGAIDNKEYNCNDCLRKYQGRSDAQKMLNESKAVKGCSTAGRAVTKIFDVSFERCPGNFVSKNISFYHEYYEAFKKGVMPFEGSLGDQPNKIIEVFRILSFIEYERQKKEVAKQNGRRFKPNNRR